MTNQLYLHDTITTPSGDRYLLEIYISPAPAAARRIGRGYCLRLMWGVTFGGVYV